jgi:diketogulonate reductase-like aldo/keto reductase/AraC-like DNA-binding protein
MPHKGCIIIYGAVGKTVSIDSPDASLQLKTPNDYARNLSIHVNSLNRSVKKLQEDTSQQITGRIIQEANALLKHTDWNIAEIAYGLGFENLLTLPITLKANRNNSQCTSGKPCLNFIILSLNSIPKVIRRYSNFVLLIKINTVMKFRKLGNTGEQLSAIGLGCMGMSFAYGPADEQESINTLHRALDLGVNFWDTADMYANGENEKLISKVLVPNRDKIFIATKFGFRFEGGKASHSGAPGTYFDGSPEWIRKAVDLSLQRLKIDTIDLYYAHRIDPNVPVEETVGAMAELVKAGKVKYIGLSEASAESIRKANKIHQITALQSEYSILTKDIENEILPTVRELGITLVPYSPLARGLFC